MRQDNVALIAVLEATEAPGRSVNGDRRQLVCVANTHVHSNPELTDVKLWQARAVFRHSNDMNQLDGWRALSIMLVAAVTSLTPTLPVTP